jgi:hypothetical protein
MVAGDEVAEDGLTWTLHLRDGLRLHDNEPVLARDVVASIRRFSVRTPFASALMSATDELSVPDDRAVRFRLKRPFPAPTDRARGARRRGAGDNAGTAGRDLAAEGVSVVSGTKGSNPLCSSGESRANRTLRRALRGQ